MSDGSSAHSVEQVIADAEAAGVYENELFIKVRNEASDRGEAVEIALAALKTIETIAMDPTTRKVALSVRVKMQNILEGRR
jgi:predicted nucleic acid-binding protein